MSEIVDMANEVRRGSVGLGVRLALGWSLGLVAAIVAMTIKLI